MTELDKIKEGLARHQHSTAVMRLANPPFIEGVSKEQLEWLIAQLDETNVLKIREINDTLQQQLTQYQKDLRDSEERNKSNLHTIEQLSVKMAHINTAHGVRMETAKGEIDALQQELNAHKDRIAELEKPQPSAWQRMVSKWGF